MQILAYGATYLMVIYRLTNCINGKIYVGKAADLQARLYMHSRAHDHQRSSLHRAIRKYGFTAFSVDVLEDGIIDEQVLNEKEIHWIASLRASDRSVGYNLTNGGEGMLGWQPSAETIAKFSRIRKGKVPKQHVLDAMHAGARRPKSPITRERMSASASKRPRKPNGRFERRT